MSAEKIYTLKDRRKMVEDLKEGYLRIMQTVINSRSADYITPLFAAAVKEEMTELYFRFKERIERTEKPPKIEM